MEPHELDIDGLTVTQKLELIDRLWDSLADSPEVLDWHREELERRLEDADAAPELGIPWENVRAELVTPAQQTDSEELRTPADYVRAIDRCLEEIQQMRGAMDADQLEMDRVKAETRGIVADAKADIR